MLPNSPFHFIYVTCIYMSYIFHITYLIYIDSFIYIPLAHTSTASPTSLLRCIPAWSTLTSTINFMFVKYIIYINLIHITHTIHITYINFNCQLHLHHTHTPSTSPTSTFIINFIYITCIIYINFTYITYTTLSTSFTQQLLVSHRSFCDRSCYAGIVIQELTSQE